MSAAKVGVLLAVLLLVAVANDWSVPDRLIVMLAVTMILAWVWSRLSLQRLGLTRSLSMDRVRAGEWITEEFTLSNHSRLPKLWVEVLDLSTLTEHNASQVVRLGGKRASAWSVRTRAERRGAYRLGPVSLQSGDPLGLFTQRRMIPATHDLVVYPPVVDVSNIALPGVNMFGGNVSRSHSSMTAHQVAGIRGYVPGDPLNRISWSATARLGQMMVKELDPEPTSDIWVMLDINDLSSSLGQDDVRARIAERAFFTEAIEYAIAVAGSLAEACLHDGRKVGFIFNRGMPIRIDADSSQRQWLRIFEALAVAVPFGTRSLSEAIQADAARFTRNSGLIVVTTSPNDDWVGAARSLVIRQIPVTAVLIGEVGSDTPQELDDLAFALIAAHAQVSRLAPGERLGFSQASAHARTA